MQQAHSLVFETLRPIEDDLQRVEAILAFLHSESDLVVRADLAAELVRSCALWEDANDRALYPDLEEFGFDVIAQRLRASSRSLREAMVPIYRATLHTVPINVHSGDAGFEEDLSELIRAVERHLRLSETAWSTLVAGLGNRDRQEIRAHLEDARRHAVEHPAPPHGRLRRLLVKLLSKLDRLQDTSTQYHPGRDRLGD